MDKVRHVKTPILVAGGGPAGAAAAIAARLSGADVRVCERRSSCRHKVCGEFLSPHVAEILSSLQVWDEFARSRPQKIVRSVLHLGRHTKTWNLSEPAWGLSRLALDRLLLDKAVSLGAALRRGQVCDLSGGSEARIIVASGRRCVTAASDRLFGFKAHFSGPTDDMVELFFHAHGYAGVSCVEDGITNVCGIAPESLLREYDFDFDELLSHRGPLRDRLSPLRRTMDWITTGPLSFSAPGPAGDASVYPAGDALGFVDPYTGSGIMNALLTGRLAGIAASRNTPSSEYLEHCQSMLAQPFRVSSILRHVVEHPAAHWLAQCVPGETLFRWTRASPA